MFREKMVDRVAHAIWAEMDRPHTGSQDLAKAAIAAMREPDAPMLTEMIARVKDANSAQDGWKIMIDTALGKTDGH
jgi:hypothetical protein